MNQQDIAQIIKKPQFPEIIEEQDFYFLKGQQALNKWLQLEISDQMKKELINLTSNYKKLLEISKDDKNMGEICDLLLEITSYIDIKAKDKLKYNQYSDKRTIAAANVRMGNWFGGLIKLKFNHEEIFGSSIINAFNYLQNPELYSNILSDNHRNLISSNLFKKTYVPDHFEDDLKAYFSEYNIRVKNKDNYTYLLTSIVYTFKHEWIETVEGLLAADGTGWHENELDLESHYDGLIVWNSKKPGGGKVTLKFLADKVKDGETFPIYYGSRGEINYKANIIDFATTPEELDAKNWPFENIKNHLPRFSDYKDDKKKARIVFWADSMEKIDPIDVNEFNFYGSYSRPTQDNLSPIKELPSNESIIKNISDPIEKTTAMPLNQIFYGPPGTGKTYHTILRAVEITHNQKIASYEDALKIFKSKLHDQIEFITFHQNYSYEDFIQGLRPDTENDSQLTFERKDGVFKVLADRALKNIIESNEPPIIKKTFEETFNKFINPLVEGEVDEIEVAMKRVSYFITTVSNKAIDFRNASGGTAHTLSIGTLRKMYEAESVMEIQGLSSYYSPLLEKLLKLGKDSSGKKEIIPKKNYVIIIDEINRANISRVFGELITLIEPDKRSHGKIPLEAKLPSGDKFIVPSNLYIIGTMNTADKSIALLDIALRRRFEFVSMYPKYEIEGQEIYDVEILRAINEKIIKSKGHDFQIGHSYFMGEENRDLIQRMNKKVIPLLLEYYMNDDKEVKRILQEAGLKIKEGEWPIQIEGRND